MLFSETTLPGSFLISLDPREDERGFFARVFCEREFRDRGLESRVAQCSISSNRRKHTLRGMHWQAAPYAETKVIRCTRGSIFDVMIDLRRNSPTFLRHYGVVLSDVNRKMVYIPEGFAHGFLTLQEDTEVFYQMSQFYSPDHARGARWNDPAFGIAWPVTTGLTMHHRDRSYPDFQPDSSLLD